MFHDFFKVRGVNEAILDFRDLSNVQLKNDSVQAFDPKWDQVSSAVTDRTTDSISERLYKMQVEKSAEMNCSLQVYAQPTTLGDKKYDFRRLKLMVQRNLEQEIKEDFSVFEQRQSESKKGK